MDGRGAIRLYGAFADAAEAAEHAQVVAAEDPSVSLMVVKAREWLVIASSPERLQDTAIMAAKRREIMSLLHDTLESDAADFRKAYAQRGQERQPPPEPPTIHDSGKDDDDEDEDAAGQGAPAATGGVKRAVAGCLPRRRCAVNATPPTMSPSTRSTTSMANS